jgi:hypothetical protein
MVPPSKSVRRTSTKSMSLDPRSDRAASRGSRGAVWRGAGNASYQFDCLGASAIAIGGSVRIISNSPLSGLRPDGS